MTRRSHPALRLGGWLVLVVVTLLALHRAGSGSLAAPPLSHPAEWANWLAGRDPVVAAVALLRLLALLAAWYLLVASIIGVGLRLVRAHALVAVADRLTLPAARRLMAATAGLTLASGISPGLAFARTSPVPAAVAGPAHPLATAAAPPETTTTTITVPRQPPPTLTMRLVGPADAAAPTPAAVPERAPPVAATTAQTWTVQPGECFWSIAADVLERAWKRPPTDAEIVPYWRRLIDENRARLADRDNPDLIFPGQSFTVLPPPPE